jgi:hypothetical protein
MLDCTILPEVIQNSCFNLPQTKLSYHENPIIESQASDIRQK